jgi:hypothetical protein
MTRLAKHWTLIPATNGEFAKHRRGPVDLWNTPDGFQIVVNDRWFCGVPITDLAEAKKKALAVVANDIPLSLR